MLMAFIVIALGSSYAMNKFALVSFKTEWIITFRMVLASLVLGAILLFTGRSYPKSLTIWVWAAWLALVGNILPFALITWGTTYVPTGLVSILVAPTAVPILVLAHVFVAGERLTKGKIIGLALALFGVLIVIGLENFAKLEFQGTAFWAQLAILTSTIGFAANNVSVRLMPNSDLVSLSAAVMLIASVICLITTPFFAELPELATITPMAVISIAFLGTVTSAAATLAIYAMIRLASVGFSSYLNYLLPPYALALGIVVFSETLTKSAFLGLSFILFGVWFSERSTRSN